jgi:hypothetical protein
MLNCQLMNNKHNKKNEANEALLGVILLIIIAGFFLFKFFKQNDVVVNQNQNIDNQEVTTSEKSDYKSQVYQEYLDKLQALKTQSSSNTDAENNLAKEMTQKVIDATNFEFSNKEVKNSSFSYSKVKYQENINKILATTKTEGLGEEMKIFLLQAQSSQLSDNGQTLDLSDSDKEYLIYSAKAYEDFGSQVQNLETPTDFLKVANLLVNKSYDTATILRRMAIEDDPLLNAAWFARYTNAVKVFYESNKNNQ